MKYFMAVQALAIVLLASVAIMYAYQYLKYRKIKKLYRAEYAKKSLLRSLGMLLPFMPKQKSRRYRNTENFIMDAGFRISVEGFYLAKTMLFILGLVFFISIQTTNTFMLYEGIVSDFNIGKSLMDKVIIADAAAIRLEKEMFEYVNSCIPRDKITLRELSEKRNSQKYIDYIESMISSRWTGLEEDTGLVAERMYRKLIKIRQIEQNYPVYFTSLAAAVVMYFIPNIIGFLKLVLIEDKRDWEILNYIYVFSIFGRLPPFNIKNVLANILVIADIYRLIIAEALNNIKSGKGEASFDGLLQRIDKQELFELLEAMRLSVNTGLLDIVDSIDEMAANQLKWLEIKSIKRRKSKQVIAMVPVVLVMLAAMVYFSYSLSILSNPMNLIK